MKSKFCITTFDYANDYTPEEFCRWKLPNDYHCVYILENGTDAYIGESLRVVKRAQEHIWEHSGWHFTHIHIITADFMEGTPAEHYEKLLIRLMKVDGRFNIVNRKDGNDTHYERINHFELLFDCLWDQLVEKNLVKTKKFQLILNSNAYKYSPYTILTPEQSKALTHIVNVLNSDETAPYSADYARRPILINGVAGTGKTVVATSLFHFLRNDAVYKCKKIALVVANEQMRNILKDVFVATCEGLSGKDVISPIELTKRRYDIVICDEVHALRRNKNLVFYKKHFEEGNGRLGLDNSHDELDWILLQSACQVLFYDKEQCVKRSDIRDDYVQERIHKNKYRGFRPVELKAQMRIKAGNSYVPYIHAVLRQKATKKQIFKNYDFRLFTSFAEMRDAIVAKDEQLGLSKLCSGYAWKWISKNDKSKFDIVIEGIGIRWNRDKKKWIDNIDSRHEMGSVYTLRGLDLNYVGLVIGPDLYFDPKEKKIKVQKKSLFSNDVKKGASDDEIEKYVLNTYAILFTRAIEGTYVYVCDDALREYFKTFIEPA